MVVRIRFVFTPEFKRCEQRTAMAHGWDFAEPLARWPILPRPRYPRRACSAQASTTLVNRTKEHLHRQVTPARAPELRAVLFKGVLAETVSRFSSVAVIAKPNGAIVDRVGALKSCKDVR